MLYGKRALIAGGYAFRLMPQSRPLISLGIAAVRFDFIS
jgi:hypothetical protein